VRPRPGGAGRRHEPPVGRRDHRGVVARPQQLGPRPRQPRKNSREHRAFAEHAQAPAPLARCLVAATRHGSHASLKGMPTPTLSRRLAVTSATVALTFLTLTGCTPTVTLEPAADATNPECAEVIVRLPDMVDGNEYRYTDAQGTGAWGEPSAVLLRCGVPVPGPSPLPCVTLRDV